MTDSNIISFLNLIIDRGYEIPWVIFVGRYTTINIHRWQNLWLLVHCLNKLLEVSLNYSAIDNRIETDYSQNLVDNVMLREFSYFTHISLIVFAFESVKRIFYIVFIMIFNHQWKFIVNGILSIKFTDVVVNRSVIVAVVIEQLYFFGNCSLDFYNVVNIVF
jgi:hypothetical protein